MHTEQNTQYYNYEQSSEYKGLSDGQIGSLRAINMEEVEIATFAVASNNHECRKSKVLMERFFD